MPKKLESFRLSKFSKQQIGWLMKQYRMSQAQVVALALDRLAQRVTEVEAIERDAAHERLEVVESDGAAFAWEPKPQAAVSARPTLPVQPTWNPARAAPKPASKPPVAVIGRRSDDTD